ncbi:Oligopeptide-binding protein SarA precursor [Streptococcus constellatus]|uniref:Oligopeptide-binding protein SarA n=1 Tax=Streptococcus constellatus TaxID=76860 RepID=A0A564T8A0_STRCV|nr:peptide ABC transporter substrate-binding protein [Streptococcus constellatus]VUX02891.1 Oligopeptide-binding protein SarA precursor [Streptococcus constellatus]VUX14117.1 Oligopeptide-binding protein SarA precursor [Streptococcus gordonii]
MKSVKSLAAMGMTLASVFLLAACGKSSPSGANTTYSYVYSYDPDTLDYTVSNRAVTSDVIVNLIDGLLENDKYGNFIPSLAEDWTVSKDGLTYTYKLRKGVKWYTHEGDEYAEVKAQDFVTGLKHAADNQSAALPIVQTSIKGLDAYVRGESKDFSTVGVKAVDDYTVEYTLNQPESYWNSKTTMGILFPINEDFLKSTGKEFGTVKPSSLLYNGAYLLKSYTSKSSIEYKKNENYWDKDNVKITDVKLTFYDGSDQEALVRNFTDGAYTTARLYPNSSSYASVQKQYKDNIVYSPQDATSFYYAFNHNRKAYNFTSKTTDAQKAATTAAVQNKDFRQAINFAFDRTSYGAQQNGEDGATKTLRNLLVPPTFVQVGDKTFGSVVESDLVSYGDEWKDVKLDDAQDAFYNADKAKAEFAKAKEALQAQGVEFPIHLDLPVNQTSTLLVQQANSFKQSVESTLGKENVVIDVQQMSDDNMNNITYFAATAAQKDYDITLSGWAPDFQDPSTYLEIFDPDSGAMLRDFGLEPGENKELAEKLGLYEFQKLNKAASEEKQDTVARYTKYAAAQAWLTDSSLVITTQSNGGNPGVRKTVPFSKAYSLVGIKGDAYVFKYMEIQKDIVTTKEYEVAEKKWTEEKEKSNAEAQEDLKNHVK